MAVVNVAKVSSGNLDRVPVLNGQILFVPDAKRIFFDFDNKRQGYCEPTVNTTSYWNTNRAYIPFVGQVIVYSDFNICRELEDGKKIFCPGIKIGDGENVVSDLPFINYGYATIEDLSEHIRNTVVHITAEERSFWNNKVSCSFEDETVIFTTN